MEPPGWKRAGPAGQDWGAAGELRGSAELEMGVGGEGDP